MTVDTAERKQIIEEVNQFWDELTGVLKGFSQEELEIPDVIGIWSLKDLIGHLETWDRIAIKKIDYAERGETRPWWQVEESPFDDINTFNEADADKNRHRTIDDLWANTETTHQELLTRLESTPVLSRELIEEDTYGHYRDHLKDIRVWQSSPGRAS